MDLDPLSRRLLGSVSRDFFRPLSRPSAAIYIDCADRIADTAGDAGRIPHADAIALVRETLASHPEILLAEDEGASLRDARQRAGQLFNRLCDAGWLEDQQLGGLIMWVPAGFVYVFAGLAFVVGWMRASDRRVRQWESLLSPAAVDGGGAV